MAEKSLEYLNTQANDRKWWRVERDQYIRIVRDNSKTRDSVLSHFQKSRGELKIRSAMEYFHEIRGTWRNETLPNLLNRNLIVTEESTKK